MEEIIIEQKKFISGSLKLPSDKSISHRAIMLGAISQGRTDIKNCLECDDCNYTIRTFKEMGIKIVRKNGYTYVYGNGLFGLRKPSKKIFLGNSGTSMRLLLGILAGQNFKSILSADRGLSKRPMARVIKPLTLMGARIKGRNHSNFAPLEIEGSKLKPITYKLPIPSAQVKSAILLAGLYAKGKTTVKENFKSRDHTERMLICFGAKVEKKTFLCSVRGIADLKASIIEIPGDISSASFFIVASTLLKGSELVIEDVGINPTRVGFIEVLKRMGANITISKARITNQEPIAKIIVRYSPLKGTTLKRHEIPLCIDELPVLMVAASLSEGRTTIKGASELRVKETDRINSMVYNLKKLGAKIFSEGDDIYIEGVSQLRGSTVLSFNDHRTAMSMAVAGLLAKGKTRILGIECVTKSFPDFFITLKKLIR
ncbi:MAG: 3-phosphoshikimate 1-carboxyvinyltransferase [Candidatus Omnitrophica bacterium]|nr:3-phosphoshikimate 1-carboxyvinyltransferase [Candidatus Omnitrophota bacterium]